MTDEEILHTIADFARCAALAQQAGYDGVEIMGSEGYLINQFLVERTNQRHDDWGGNQQNRRRFALEIVRAVRPDHTLLSSIACRCSIWWNPAPHGKR